jgi:hypothetical protein
MISWWMVSLRFFLPGCLDIEPEFEDNDLWWPALDPWDAEHLQESWVLSALVGDTDILTWYKSFWNTEGESKRTMKTSYPSTKHYSERSDLEMVMRWLNASARAWPARLSYLSRIFKYSTRKRPTRHLSSSHAFRCVIVSQISSGFSSAQCWRPNALYSECNAAKCEPFDATTVSGGCKTARGTLGDHKSIENLWLILMIYFEQMWAYGSNSPPAFPPITLSFAGKEDKNILYTNANKLDLNPPHSLDRYSITYNYCYHKSWTDFGQSCFVVNVTPRRHLRDEDKLEASTLRQDRHFLVCTDKLRPQEGWRGKHGVRICVLLSCEIGLAGWFDLGYSPSYQSEVRVPMSLANSRRYNFSESGDWSVHGNRSQI